MATATIRKPASFRLREDLLERLKRNAKRQNRTLNNYVESVLLDVVYREPNETTMSAVSEAINRKEYPSNQLYNNADELFQALDKE